MDFSDLDIGGMLGKGFGVLKDAFMGTVGKGAKIVADKALDVAKDVGSSIWEKHMATILGAAILLGGSWIGGFGTIAGLIVGGGMIAGDLSGKVQLDFSKASNKDAHDRIQAEHKQKLDKPLELNHE